MIIKSFTAPTVAAALKEVRETMGGQAVILKTRMAGHGNGAGRKVEVTACIDEAIVAPGKIDDLVRRQGGDPQQLTDNLAQRLTDEIMSCDCARADSPSRLDRKLDSVITGHRNTEPLADIDRIVRPVYLDLLDADIPVEIARQITDRTVADLKKNSRDPYLAAHDILTAEIERTSVRRIPFRTGMRVVLVGFSGAGKTSALARLATEIIVRDRLKVTLSSLDDIRVAAREEIGSYADILNLPLARFDELAERNHTDAVTLIDTPSIPNRAGERAALAGKIKKISPDLVFLVFSVCARSRDLLESLHYFETLKPTHLIGGHLDESERWGGLLAMSGFLDIPLAYLVDSPGGAGPLRPVETGKIAGHILKLEEAEDE